MRLTVVREHRLADGATQFSNGLVDQIPAQRKEGTSGQQILSRSVKDVWVDFKTANLPPPQAA